MSRLLQSLNYLMCSKAKTRATSASLDTMTTLSHPRQACDASEGAAKGIKLRRVGLSEP